MKKLLAIAILGLLSMGNIFSHVPTQSIFKGSIHTVEPVNEEKVSAMRSLLSSYLSEDDLYQGLNKLYDKNQFNEKNIIALINQYNNRYQYKKEEKALVSSLDKDSLIEFLKNHKNQLVQEIIDILKDSFGNAGFGDGQIDDNVMGLAFSIFMSAFPTIAEHNNTSPINALDFARLTGIMQGVCLTFVSYNLFQIVRYHFNIHRIRRRQAQMRKIEKLILAIESFKN